jgi:hypothetical protein
MMSDRPKGIELNTVQIVASMGAAVTGAVLTSYLGDGGTILGTAVGSGASTAGFAIYKHYLARTKEKVTPVIVEHARQWTPTSTMTGDGSSSGRNHATRADVPHAGVARADATRADHPVGGNGSGRGATAADWDQARRTAPGWAQPTQAEPGWGPDATRQDINRQDLNQTRLDANQTRQDYGQTRQDFGQPRFVPHQDGPDAEATRTAGYDATRYGTVRMGDGTVVNGGPDGAGPEGAAGGNGNGRHGKSGGGPLGFLANRPRWLVPAATAAAVFVVALIIITVVELGTGKPIGASVWGRSQSGTTLGGSHSKTTATPTTNATPTQSPTAPSSVGATGSQSTGASTTGPTTGPTPTPSSVPTVGSTGGGSVPASGAAGNGNAGNATPAPGQ